jgi:NAD(P)-dependent dehydrogenase (short-subunit alcohol dehydrogenase family)
VDKQRVLVTAGASGIGRAIVEAFYAKGAKVFVCDIDEAALKALHEALPGVHTAVCDISSRTAIEKMVPEAASRLGGLDVLINNAGIPGPTSPVENFDPDGWDQVMQINLTGTFNVTRMAIAYLKQSSRGVVINMSSVAGRFGYPNRSAYSTSKWGIIGFTKSLSIELGEYGIRVNALLPGATDGPRFQQVLKGRADISGKSLDAVAADAMGSQSLKHLVDPAHIADLAVFLASESGRSISGQALSIDCDMQHTST